MSLELNSDCCMTELFGFAPVAVAAALFAAFGSAFVRGLTGFGMAILLVPILALALTPVDAVLLTNFWRSSLACPKSSDWCAKRSDQRGSFPLSCC